MVTAAVSTPDSDKAIRRWRLALTIGGIALILLAAVIEWIAVNYHQVTKVYDIGKASAAKFHTVTVTGPAGPPTTLITALLGAGVIMLLVAAFFPRISKIVFPWGGELDFATNAALTGVIATKTNNMQEARELYARSVPRVVEAMAVQAPTTRMAVRRQVAWNTQPLLDEDTLNRIVDEVK